MLPSSYEKKCFQSFYTRLNFYSEHFPKICRYKYIEEKEKKKNENRIYKSIFRIERFLSATKHQPTLPPLQQLRWAQLRFLQNELNKTTLTNRGY